MKVMAFFQPTPRKGFSLYSCLELYSGHNMQSTKPPHHAFDKPAVSSIKFTKSDNMLFFLSATPLWGE
jgi:hypothetical protein